MLPSATPPPDEAPAADHQATTQVSDIRCFCGRFYWDPVLAGELALAGGAHRTAFAAYESRIRDFAEGCQKTSDNAGPFFAPPTERRIRGRDRMYRLLVSRPMAAFFKRLTERSATNIRLPEYPG